MNEGPRGIREPKTGLKAGKLPADLLAGLLAGIRHSDPRVLGGPGVGRDAALISFGSSTLIAKSDPVTFATDLAGWYAVQINANDVAVSGGEPRWFLATVLLPEGTEPSVVRAIFRQIQEATDALGIDIVGGHTEISIGLPRPVIVGMMLGEAAADSTLSAAGARPGDSVILTQGIAIEGTALLAREAPARLRLAGMQPEVIARAADYLFKPGISVLQDARLLRSCGVTAMHDPTEGGLATALAEIASASGCGVEVDAHAVNVLPETGAICDALGIDPWGLIASGALLATAPDEAARDAVERMRSRGVTATVIGRMTVERALKVHRNGRTLPLATFERDEIARFLE